MREYQKFYNTHRPHQGINNGRPLPPLPPPTTDQATVTHLDIRRRRQLGGILDEYHHAAGTARTTFSASTVLARPRSAGAWRRSRHVGVADAAGSRPSGRRVRGTGGRRRPPATARANSGPRGVAIISVIVPRMCADRREPRATLRGATGGGRLTSAHGGPGGREGIGDFNTSTAVGRVSVTAQFFVTAVKDRYDDPSLDHRSSYLRVARHRHAE
ncbi:hypothetical protein [Actinosynnema sp. NPDC023587]|uniref:hypothetical protein n=1 Tax=Actinosynnema sp. NPDC023587 TaxID=3154695 RepID=UPI0033DC259F